MKILRKIITGVSILLLLANQGAIVASAQVATDSASTSSQSASLSPTPTLEYATSSAQLVTVQDTTSQNPFTDTWTSANQSTTTGSQPTLSLDSSQSSSAQQFQAPNVGKLSKRSFSENEPVSLVVANQNPGDLSVVLINPEGKQVDSGAIQETANGTQTTIQINSSNFQFAPGKYTLKVTDSTGKTTTQDFTWGVLVLNTNKSLYLPNETSQIAIAVLDDKGETVCNASVNLDITSPNGQVTHLSTADKSIVVNPQCHSHDLSLTPDYQTQYQVGGIGDYSLSLSATTLNGTNTISDTIRVVGSVPFDVERISATRLYPYNTYPMIFHITANQNFTGTIVETAPANFQISPFASASAQTFTSSNLIMPIPDLMAEFGQSSLTLSMPFTGNYPMVQGFGVALTDPIEAAYYNQFGLAGHDGLDFAMPDNTPVLAADSGTVSFAGDGAYGTMIAIDHSWGRSYYGHLSSILVKEGDRVAAGQEIALSGHSGHVTGPHLHFGIKPLHPNMQNGFYGKVDPTPYLAALSGNSSVLGIATANISQSEKIISWNVSLTKGESIDIAYNYQSPPQSPAYYTLGPLKFVDNTKQVVFQEARQWQLAIDADSTATGACTAGADDTTVGSQAWGTPSNACGSVATVTTSASSLTTTTLSHYLKATGFGFTIPTNAVIHGIQFSIVKSCVNNGAGRCVDNSVELVKASTVQTSGTNQASGTTWNTSATSTSYGSSTSISWGGTWTYSDINNSGFGIALSAKGNSSSKAVTATVTSTAALVGVTATITYNQVPNAPTNDTPTNSATGVSVSTNLTMHATDPESDTLQYDLLLYGPGNTTCSSTPTEFNQTVSQTGWDSSSYSSGATATLTPGTLSASSTYSWKVRAIDASGSNTFGSYSTCTSFTTGAAGPTLDQLLRHGEWFSSGVVKPFTF